MNYFILFQVEFIHMQSTVFSRMKYCHSYCEQLLSFKLISFILSSGAQHLMTRDFTMYQSVTTPY